MRGEDWSIGERVPMVREGTRDCAVYDELKVNKKIWWVYPVRSWSGSKKFGLCGSFCCPPCFGGVKFNVSEASEARVEERHVRKATRDGDGAREEWQLKLGARVWLWLKVFRFSGLKFGLGFFVLGC
ncbi:hypothetical protein J1N35_002367 [Gossypium stocksii]|uniref:Uncharacterized protein n=1 Tax=Gossypium stocksii TaxID=47602 RepID=A0A9D3WKV5_9ROSI|nr:hypothetical protein J1N35_002367 [Gossypium stocksii]